RAVWNDYLLFWRDLIFAPRVVHGIPGLVAAPGGPATRPRLSAKAASIRAFSCAPTVAASGWGAGGVGPDSRASQLASTEKVSVSHTIIDPSITFWSSRMLP